MPDENRVFDVSKPSRVSPSATSRPVIVGHHPMNDPMVREEGGLGTESRSSTTKIPITGNDDSAETVTVEQAVAASQTAEPAAGLPEGQPVQGSPAIFSDHNDEKPHSPEPPEPLTPPESVGQGPFTAIESDSPHPAPQSELPPPAPPQEPDIEGLHFNEPKPKRGRGKLITAGLVVLLIAAYLAIDSGLVNAGIKMPFHIFKQKTETVSTPSASTQTNKPTTAAPSLPNGFKEYKLADTDLTFAAPLAWGDPTSTTDPGYSKRGGGNQTDGTYAYLVNFATNKDIQIAVTSSKYLPAARAPLYYDYLQWCVGSSDNKIYQSVLNFSTANKVDTPTTITCNQGPIAGASVVDNSTIVQLKAADAAGKTIGDIYTANLKDPSLVVFRAKDAAMTNGDNIKQLFNTIKIITAPSSSTAGQ